MNEELLALIGKWPYGDYFQNKYILALLTIILSLIFAKLMLFIFNKYLQGLAKKTKTQIDDLLFEGTKKPISYLALVYGLKFAFQVLEWGGVISKITNSALAVIFLLILMRVVDLILKSWADNFSKRTKTKIDEVILPLFHKFVNIIFVIIALIWLLHLWGVNITPYLAGVGISGVIFGLAMQDSLKNIFGGITLILDKTFVIGDKIQLENQTAGTVYDIGLRSTKIITSDNEIIFVPNGYLANSKIQNFSKPNPKATVKVDFAVQNGTQVSEVKKIILAK